MFAVNARALIERERDGITELVLQTRVKPNEPEGLELPGGRLELFEPILTGLRREIYEETGLTDVRVIGEETRMDSLGTGAYYEVECIQPFAVFQTLAGPVDCTGAYFLCQADGPLLPNGDASKNVHWRSVDEIRQMMEQDPAQFAGVDRVGIQFYLAQRNIKRRVID
ncbi:NUDIX hydrolase [Paenibacillus koleovorans]|uniref:NUDIX hydrolase n=1 Tax=Paenibacillus koleovorans TaxID=121608 RepID=UPI000FD86488|nr:NUDIX domain-containing protein [Paenibacillus koleovorans]